MSKYTKLAEEIIRNIGGKDNVKDLTHCVTRLRFYLRDESQADDNALKSLDGVAGVVKSMGQYMVVIGEHVSDVYEEVCHQLGIKQEGAAGAETKKEKKGLLDRALVYISGGMASVLNLLCACGIIKGLMVVFTMLGLSSDTGIYALLDAAGDCLFYCMPIAMGFNLAKNAGIDPFFGLIFGAALIYPTIQGVDLNFFGYVVNATYTSSFLPVAFGMLLAIPLYKWLDKHIHHMLKGFLTPMITLLISFPLTFVIIGPLANLISAGLNVLINFLFNLSPIIGGVIMGGLWQILVMFGVHGLPTMFAFYDLLAGNPSAFLASVGMTCFAVCGTLLAVTFKTKSDELKSSSGSALVSAFLGVTEPAMYGIIIARKQLLAVTCIGCAAGGFLAGLFGLKIYTYAGLGIIGVLGYLNPAGPNILGIVISMIASFVVSFLLAMSVYKDDKTSDVNENAGGNKGKNLSAALKKDQNIITVNAPADGMVCAASSSSDEVFSSDALGKGCVILPDNGNVYAPFDGTVCTLFPTKHAIGIVGDNGVELLIHIGINTVSLNGKYFETRVSQGDQVKAGQLLVTFDKEAIEKEGFSTEIPVIVTNTDAYLDVIEVDHAKHVHGDEILKILNKKGE